MKVAVSGYFDPPHSGHINLYKEAKELAGDDGELVVILGRDDQLIGKKGFYFMPFEERAEIIKNIRYVDTVMAAIDDDGTVNKSLLWLMPDIFANGGDRGKGNIPEDITCKANNIKMVFGVGGGKSNASSSIVQEGLERYTKTHIEERPWGLWKIINQGPGFKVKLLQVNPKSSLSLQSHKHRNEHWVVVQGRASIVLNELYFDVLQNESCYIPKKSKHQLINKTNDILKVIEVQTGEYLKEDDIVRFEEQVIEK